MINISLIEYLFNSIYLSNIVRITQKKYLKSLHIIAKYIAYMEYYCVLENVCLRHSLYDSNTGKR